MSEQYQAKEAAQASKHTPGDRCLSSEFGLVLTGLPHNIHKQAT